MLSRGWPSPIVQHALEQLSQILPEVANVVAESQRQASVYHRCDCRFVKGHDLLPDAGAVVDLASRVQDVKVWPLVCESPLCHGDCTIAISRAQPLHSLEPSRDGAALEIQLLQGMPVAIAFRAV